MSGIVGIVNRDGGPIDRELLREMTQSLANRGPDAQEVWLGGAVGFGHTLLRTTAESNLEKQPVTLEGQVWITADARVDRREELIHELQSAGREVSKNSTDPELILHAYQAWDELCLERLLGDFSFGIWDARQRRLFCARDHFGVKPFYYSLVKDTFLFSNTLKCLRLSPAVSGTLNDAAIADFLLFDDNQNPATTTFRDIQRLPAGHFLVCSRQQFRIERYWSLPVEEPIYYKRAGDYVEHFLELLRTTVRDRLRADRAGVFMSGGLDSTALAATAQEIGLKTSSSFDLRAYTWVYDWLIPHDERHYAGLTADALRIPIHFQPLDHYSFYERWQLPELQPPQPVHTPLGLAVYYDLFKQITPHCRVMLYGEGPDNAMHYEWQSYARYLLKTWRWLWLLRDLWWHARFHRHVPLVGALYHRVRQLGSKSSLRSEPIWIRRELLDIASREDVESQRVHAFRPVAYGCFRPHLWDSLFDGFDPANTSFPIEVRHPYMDVRMIRFLLTVPPIPWARRKFLIRHSFRNVLPDSLLKRNKTPIREDPLLARARIEALPEWIPDSSLYRYVDPEVVNTLLRTEPAGLWQNLRPVSLNFYLAANHSGV